MAHAIHPIRPELVAGQDHRVAVVHHCYYPGHLVDAGTDGLDANWMIPTVAPAPLLPLRGPNHLAEDRPFPQGNVCLVLSEIVNVNGEVRSTAAARMDRKMAAIMTARSCGKRLALTSPAGTELYCVLDELSAGILNKTEQRARSQLLPISWRAAFGQGWRSATPVAGSKT